MVDDAFFETGLLTELGHGFELRLGRMAEEDCRAAVMSHAEDLFDLGQETSLVIEKVVAVLQRLGPGKRFGMSLRICRLVPCAGLAAANGERVGRGIVDRKSVV